LLPPHSARRRVGRAVIVGADGEVLGQDLPARGFARKELGARFLGGEAGRKARGGPAVPASASSRSLQNLRRPSSGVSASRRSMRAISTESMPQRPGKERRRPPSPADLGPREPQRGVGAGESAAENERHVACAAPAPPWRPKCRQRCGSAASVAMPARCLASAH
jgi:hypothetical protein